jgi:hypothetical protein
VVISKVDKDRIRTVLKEILAGTQHVALAQHDIESSLENSKLIQHLAFADKLIAHVYDCKQRNVSAKYIEEFIDDMLAKNNDFAKLFSRQVFIKLMDETALSD